MPSKPETPPKSQSDFFGHERISEMMDMGGELFAEWEEEKEKIQRAKELLQGIKDEESLLRVSEEDFRFVRNALQTLFHNIEPDNEELREVLEQGRLEILRYARDRILKKPAETKPAEVHQLAK